MGKKPEVLIIACVHLNEVIQDIFPRKIVMRRLGKGKKQKVPTVGLDEENLTAQQIEMFKIPAQRVEDEIKKIKKFGARRILYEFNKTKPKEKVCKKLFLDRDLGSFVMALLKISEIERKLVVEEVNRLYRRHGINNQNPSVSLLHAIKLLSFRLSGAKVYDVVFFDDFPTMKKDMAYVQLYAYLSNNLFTTKGDLIKVGLEWQKWREKRETAMVRNIKQSLTDKTVIMCGKSHVPAIVEGLKNSASLSYKDFSIKASS